MQVAGVGVQDPGLAGERSQHVGVTVADVGDVVVCVEIAPALSIEKPHPLAAYHVHGLVVEQRKPGAEQSLASDHQIRIAHARSPQCSERQLPLAGVVG